MLYINSTIQLDGSFVGGDKSVSHRALMLAAIADGQCVVRNLSQCDDVMSTVSCLRALGAKIRLDGTTAFVTPIATPVDNAVLDCGNSGTTARLLCGLVTGLGVRATFVGDGSLSVRPMKRVTEPLAKMGAKFAYPSGALLETLGGKLVGRTIDAEVNSAQVKSAVLLAGLFAEGKTAYVEGLPTRDHTERMLSYVGAEICGTAVGPSKVHAFDITVPCDFSSAAYLLAAALVRKQRLTVKNVGVNQLRIGFLRVLQRAGARFVLDNKRTDCGEDVADITVLPSTVDKPIFVGKEDVCSAIDEIPLIAAVAIACGVRAEFCDVGELRHKESDRVAAIVNMAQTCGQKACVDGENLIVMSDGTIANHPVFAATDDHRIVMSQAVLCIAAGGGRVANPDCVAVSFPSFWQSLGVRFGRYAVIGCNIDYSRSPELMRGFAEQADVAMDYRIVNLPRDISDDRLKSVIDGFDGCNVTVPFKQRVARLFDSELPSVNTVGKGIEPTSTDGIGLLYALDKHKFAYKNAKLWVVGAGGAAEVCIATLLQAGARVQVYNRTYEHAARLTAKYGLATDIVDPDGVLSFVPPCDFEAQIDLPPRVKYVFVASYDGKSPLLVKAKQQGIPCADGSDMLYGQGRASFEYFCAARRLCITQSND